ncbi:ATP-dependent DNA helicase pif1 [Gigaspora margarita]|uniref:ATP-dependent DNA helicase pif1 n=1 Tax=Gigaspora margarita TaxID=4874 RepID=A0A8H3X9S7_GIGMA|nr:ATP-dependent DNA helicase pif1 [Gigaspora margarita]
MLKTRKCSCCDHTKNIEEFFNHKYGYLKTCNLCRKKLNLPSASNSSITSNDIELYDGDNTSEIIELDDVEDYILTEVEACENSEIGMELDLNINVSNEEHSEVLFKKIITAIQTANGYKWNYMCQYHNTSKKQSYWYTCSLLSKYEHAASNPKRLCMKQTHFNCEGLVKLSLNYENSIMHLYLRHNELHLHPLIKESVNENIITFIKNNLYLTPSQLWEILQQQSPILTQKQ